MGQTLLAGAGRGCARVERFLLLQGLLQQVLGGNEHVVVTAGKRGPITDNAFFQLEVRACPSSHSWTGFPFCCHHPTQPAKLFGACSCMGLLSASIPRIIRVDC